MAMCINAERGTIRAWKCFQLSWCGRWVGIGMKSTTNYLIVTKWWPCARRHFSFRRIKSCQKRMRFRMYRLRWQFWRNQFFAVHLSWIRAINECASVEWQSKWTAVKVISIRINIFPKWALECRRELLTAFSRDMFRLSVHNSIEKSMRYSFMLIMMIIIIILSTRQGKRAYTSVKSASTQFRWQKIFYATSVNYCRQRITLDRVRSNIFLVQFSSWHHDVERPTEIWNVKYIPWR